MGGEGSVNLSQIFYQENLNFIIDIYTEIVQKLYMQVTCVMVTTFKEHIYD